MTNSVIYCRIFWELLFTNKTKSILRSNQRKQKRQIVSFASFHRYCNQPQLSAGRTHTEFNLYVTKYIVISSSSTLVDIVDNEV